MTSRRIGIHLLPGRCVANDAMGSEVVRTGEDEPVVDRVPLENGVHLDDLGTERRHDLHRPSTDRANLVVDLRVAERRRPGDPPRWSWILEHCEPRRLGTRQRAQIAWIGSDHDVERRHHVGESASHRPLRREVMPIGRRFATARNPAKRRLHAREAAARRRDADRATAVGSGRQRHHAGCDRRGTPTGRAARGVLEVPRVHRRPEDDVVGVRLPPELWCVGLADHHATRGDQARDQCGVGALRPTRGKGLRAACGDVARGVLQVLDADRDPGKRPRIHSGRDAVVHNCRGGTRPFGVHCDERIDRRVVRLDLLERVADHVARAELTLAHPARQPDH